MRGASLHRRGFAMVLALAALMLVSTLGLGLLRSAANRSIASRHALNEAHAALVADRIEREILHWLETSPDAPATIARPGWTLLHEHRSEMLVVHIHALDLTGRLHVGRFATDAAAGLPDPLRSALRDGVAAPAGRSAPRDRTPTSPLLEECLDVSVLALRPPWRLFPRRADVIAGTSDEVASHWVTGYGEGALNIHSAPIPLFDAALIGHGVARRDREEAIALRQEGHPIPGSLANRIISSRRPFEQHPNAVPLTDRCRAMAVLITVRGQGADRAWWIAVEHRAAPRPQRRSAHRQPAWHIVERRRIPA